MADQNRYTRVASLKTSDMFAEHLANLGVHLPFDTELESSPAGPLAQPYTVDGRTIGNRFAVLPMEGWDATPDGQATDLVRRRWQRFGLSGAKLIWGCEAVAVRHDGRANPNQLVLAEHTIQSLADLRQTLVGSHVERHGTADDLLVGLQLTHSGRFARPNRKDQLEPQILYPHPLLNAKYHLPADYPVLSDEQIDDLIGYFVTAAVRAQAIGFDFVDLKHCHGYLGHEFLGAVDRPGKYGGSFENRTRFLREIVAGIRRDAPGLALGVRFSAFDMLPFRPGPHGAGVPEAFQGPYPYAFGGDPDHPLEINLDEPIAFLRLLEELNIRLVCLTAGSPYYNPHIQRPALFPPSDGYLPPEDPLVGVARQITIAAQLKAHFPNLAIVGSGYSYLQEWLPHVGQHNVRTGRIDFVGLGRMILSYPELAADVVTGAPLRTKSICRTFSDCTTGPRNGLISGCFPLDHFYREHPQHAALKAAKRPVSQEPLEKGGQA
jgi:2,4-dienoyl-CoA reductase-like NADH-dependent reductase (Old Yellow Enzyme family)